MQCYAVLCCFIHDFVTCNRWLLLDFKREFPLEDSIRIFEVLCSHYLELNPDKALVETDKVIAKELEGKFRAVYIHPSFSASFQR